MASAHRGAPDPSGGTFDAAGDFDRFIDESYIGRTGDWDLPTLSRVDPYAATEMPAKTCKRTPDSVMSWLGD